MVETGRHVAIAFALVIGAAMSTAIGASIVFFPSLVKIASRRVLASSLSFSAGVMMYVSFIEIFQKSVGSFQNSGIDESKSHLYATICFFGGTLIMQVSNLSFSVFMPLFLYKVEFNIFAHSHHDFCVVAFFFILKLMDVLIRIVGGRDHHKTKVNKEASNSSVVNNEITVVAPHCIGCSDDPVAELKEWHRRADEEIKYGSNNLQLDGTVENSSELPVPSGEDVVDVTVDVSGKEVNKNLDDDKEASAGSVSGMSADNSETYDKEEKKRLIQMGLRTALAIALHNFPEGLATFVAALEDPRVGAVLAIAIGIHNIPEGLCVSLPVYYATGNRLKGFLWGTISGFSEPFGAFIGWLILSRYMGDVVYAILFGVVAGMMVLISLKELLPTAFRYDPEDTVITHACISGMVLMALSLVLFTL